MKGKGAGGVDWSRRSGAPRPTAAAPSVYRGQPGGALRNPVSGSGDQRAQAQGPRPRHVLEDVVNWGSENTSQYGQVAVLDGTISIPAGPLNVTLIRTRQGPRDSIVLASSPALESVWNDINTLFRTNLMITEKEELRIPQSMASSE